MAQKRRKRYDSYKSQNGVRVRRRSRAKGSPYYTDFITPDGTRIRKSTHVGNKELAVQAARMMLAEHLGLVHNTMTWDAAMKLYTTQRGDVIEPYVIKWLSERIGTLDLLDIDHEVIDQLIEDRRTDTSGMIASGKNRQVGIGTINKTLSAVRSVLNWAKNERHLLTSVPNIPRIKEDKRQSKADLFLTPADFKRLRDALPIHLRDLVTFAVLTLLRKQNVLDLKWADVNLERAEVYIEGGQMKGGKRQVVPLVPQALKALKRQVGKNPVWVWCYGKQGRHLSQIRTTTWHKAVAKSGVDPRSTFHTLRHSGASWLAQAGATESELMQAGSWSNPAVVKRYAKLRQEDKERTFGRLANIDLK